MSLVLAPTVQGMDAYDFAKPENILSSLNKEFWDGVCAVKWQERRDSLQTLKQLASTPRLATGDYADVVRELRKVRQCNKALTQHCRHTTWIAM